MNLHEHIDATADAIDAARLAGEDYVRAMSIVGVQEALGDVGRPNKGGVARAVSRAIAGRRHSEFLAALRRCEDLGQKNYAIDLHGRVSRRATDAQYAAIVATCKRIGGEG